MNYPIAAVVLAAGLSSRMAPINKLLTPMADGHAMIFHTVRHIVASKASPVVVVTGFQAPLVEAALAGLQVRFVHEPDFAAGLASSLRAGVAALPLEVQAVVIMLGDMPLVQPDLIDKLLAAYDPQANHDIIVPVWQGRRGNPRLLGRRHFVALQSISGDTGANALFKSFHDRVTEIDSPDDTVLRDFDTHEALNALKLEATQSGRGHVLNHDR